MDLYNWVDESLVWMRCLFVIGFVVVGFTKMYFWLGGTTWRALTMNAQHLQERERASYDRCLALPEKSLSGGRQVCVPEVSWQVAEWSSISDQVVHVWVAQVHQAVVWNPSSTEHGRSYMAKGINVLTYKHFVLSENNYVTNTNLQYIKTWWARRFGIQSMYFYDVDIRLTTIFKYTNIRSNLIYITQQKIKTNS